MYVVLIFSLTAKLIIMIILEKHMQFLQNAEYQMLPDDLHLDECCYPSISRAMRKQDQAASPYNNIVQLIMFVDHFKMVLVH